MQAFCEADWLQAANKCRRRRIIGNWAPGELDDVLRDGNLARVPAATYKEWFAALLDEFRNGVLGQWGDVKKSEAQQAAEMTEVQQRVDDGFNKQSAENPRTRNEQRPAEPGKETVEG